MPMSLKTAILKVAATYGKVAYKAGIIYVKTPTGEVWSFTVPMKEAK